MKIQIESTEYVEDLFQEILGEKNGSIPSEEEKEVLLQIKNLFLKNVQVAENEEGYSPEESAEQKEERTRILLHLEEAEANRISQMKALCSLRKELPERLKKEISQQYAQISQRIQEPIKKPQEKEECSPSEEIQEMSRSMKDLLNTFPNLLLGLKKNVEYVEQELKEKKRERGKQVEAHTLSILFKDELEI